MDKSTFKGVVIGATAVTAVGGIAGYQIVKQPDYAQVIKAEAVTQTVKTPRQVCEDVVVSHKAPVQDTNRIAGTAIGAVVGGVLGNQIGAGSGRAIATIGGAAAGGYAGNRIQKGMQDSDVQTSRQTRCRTVYDSHEQPAGYNVTYRLEDKEGVVHMDYNPGERIPVKDGQLVLTRSEPAATTNPQ